MKNAATRLRALLNRFRSFFGDRLRQLHLGTLPRHQAMALRQLGIVQLAVKGFRQDNCPLRASSLTFYTLLSVVPMAAMAFGIAKGFGFEKLLETQLIERFPGQEAVLLQIVAFSRALLENTRGGMIAGVGVALLLWSVIKVLSQIEAAFNRIWQVPAARTLVRKLTDYLSITLICPLLVIMSGSATVFITTQVHQITERIALLGVFSPLIALGLKMTPYLLIWTLFSFVYLVMPNTRVRLGAGVLAGILAGTVYQLAQYGYISFQVGMARYNAIYGSFAALPLFLVWLQISWLIVLAGAEVAFACQNVSRFGMLTDIGQLSHRLRQLIRLQAAQRIVKRFAEGQSAPTAEILAVELNLPASVVQELMDDLVKSGRFVYLTSDDMDRPTCQPASDIQHYTIAMVIDALETSGGRLAPGAASESRRTLCDALNAMAAARVDHPANRRLTDIE